MTKRLVMSFGCIVTVEDTIESLVQAALTWQKTPEAGSRDLESSWRRIKTAHNEAVHEYELEAARRGERTNWEAEFRYLAGFRRLWLICLDDVRRAGIFQGFAAGNRPFLAGLSDIVTGRVKFKPGFWNIIKAARDGRIKLYVLSTHWSASYIRGVLEIWGQPITVIANEISMRGSVFMPEDIFPEDSLLHADPRQRIPAALLTARDKLWALRHLDQTASDGKHAWYAGDCVSDLSCLFEYGGLVIAAGPERGGKLLETIRRVHEQVPHLRDRSHAEGNSRKPIIRWVAD